MDLDHSVDIPIFVNDDLYDFLSTFYPTSKVWSVEIHDGDTIGTEIDLINT